MTMRGDAAPLIAEFVVKLNSDGSYCSAACEIPV